MKTTLIGIIVFLMIQLVGCNPPAIDESNYQPVTTQRATATITEPKMEKTITPSIPNRSLNFNNASGEFLSSDQIPSDCNKTLNFEQAEFQNLKGLVVYDITTKELKILNDAWEDEPIYVIRNNQPTSNYVEWGVSPDNQWISYIELMRADSFDILVENPKSGEQIKNHIEGMTVGTTGIYWGNKEQIVIPLRNKGDQFEWLLWKPFSREERIVSIEIPNGSDIVEKYSIFPIYDPNTNSILSPCQQCEENEFQVFTLDNNSVLWSLDFGTGLFTTPKWEPNISYERGVVAFYFGLNKLWIFNYTEGGSTKVVLPFGSDENWPMKTYKWSNNGEYLGMIRDRKNSLNPYLSILSLKDQKLINICNDIPYGNLLWSHYDRDIAVLSNRTANEAESTLMVINVKTGQGDKISFMNKISLVGWVEP